MDCQLFSECRERSIMGPPALEDDQTIVVSPPRSRLWHFWITISQKFYEEDANLESDLQQGQSFTRIASLHDG